MGTRKRLDETQPYDLVEAEDELVIAPVQYVRESAIIYRLPNYAADRRSDLRAVREKVGSIDDLERFDELFRVHANKPGFYLQEFRLGGQVADTRVIEVKAKVEVLKEATAATTQTQHEAPAQAVNSVADTVREVKGLMKEFAAPTAQAAPLTRDEVQSMIKQIVEQLKPVQAAAPVVDPFDVIERAMKVQREIQQQAIASNPAPVQPQQGDEFDRVMSLFDRVTELRERLEPTASLADESAFGKVVGLIDTVGRNAPKIVPMIAPLLPARLQQMLAGTDAADVTTETMEPQGAVKPAQAQAAAKQSPANEQEAFQLIMHVGVNDLMRNKRVGRTADLVEEMCRSFPTLNETVDQLCALAPEGALATLQHYSGRNDLVSLGHGLVWVGNLQDELRTDDGEADEGTQATGAGGDLSIVDMARAQAS